MSTLFNISLNDDADSKKIVKNGKKCELSNQLKSLSLINSYSSSSSISSC